jgi:hypothetical protein
MVNNLKFYKHHIHYNLKNFKISGEFTIQICIIYFLIKYYGLIFLHLFFLSLLNQIIGQFRLIFLEKSEIKKQGPRWKTLTKSVAISNFGWNI